MVVLVWGCVVLKKPNDLVGIQLAARVKIVQTGAVLETASVWEVGALRPLW